MVEFEQCDIISSEAKKTLLMHFHDLEKKERFFKELPIVSSLSCMECFSVKKNMFVGVQEHYIGITAA